MQADPTPGTLDEAKRHFVSDYPDASARAGTLLERAADEFFRKSLRWRSTIEITILAGSKDIVIPAQPMGRPAKIMTLWTQFEQRRVRVPRKGNQQYLGWRPETATKGTLSFELPSDRAFEVEIGLTISDTVNDELVADYREGINALAYSYHLQNLNDGNKGNRELLSLKMSEYRDCLMMAQRFWSGTTSATYTGTSSRRSSIYYQQTTEAEGYQLHRDYL